MSLAIVADIMRIVRLRLTDRFELSQEELFRSTLYDWYHYFSLIFSSTDKEYIKLVMIQQKLAFLQRNMIEIIFRPYSLNNIYHDYQVHFSGI